MFAASYNLGKGCMQGQRGVVEESAEEHSTESRQCAKSTNQKFWKQAGGWPGVGKRRGRDR